MCISKIASFLFLGERAGGEGGKIDALFTSNCHLFFLVFRFLSPGARHLSRSTIVFFPYLYPLPIARNQYILYLRLPYMLLSHGFFSTLFELRISFHALPCCDSRTQHVYTNCKQSTLSTLHQSSETHTQRSSEDSEGVDAKF